MVIQKLAGTLFLFFPEPDTFPLSIKIKMLGIIDWGNKKKIRLTWHGDLFLLKLLPNHSSCLSSFFLILCFALKAFSTSNAPVFCYAPPLLTDDFASIWLLSLPLFALSDLHASAVGSGRFSAVGSEWPSLCWAAAVICIYLLTFLWNRHGPSHVEHRICLWVWALAESRGARGGLCDECGISPLHQVLCFHNLPRR